MMGRIRKVRRRGKVQRCTCMRQGVPNFTCPACRGRGWVKVVTR